MGEGAAVTAKSHSQTNISNRGKDTETPVIGA